MTTITVCKLADDDYTVRIHSGHKWDFDAVIKKLKEYIPTFARSWNPADKIWCIRSDHFLHRWLDVCTWDSDVEVTWETARQHQPPPRQPKASRRDQAFAALNLLPTAPPELIRAAHKTLALLHHPDKGGDLRTMQAINAAYDVLNVN